MGAGGVIENASFQEEVTTLHVSKIEQTLYTNPEQSHLGFKYEVPFSQSKPYSPFPRGPLPHAIKKR